MAQPIEVGVEGGVRTTDDVSGTLTSESKRYIVGPKVEIRLPLRLSFEFDALYQRFGFTGYEASCCGNSVTRERANSWEFPLILKFRIPVLPGRPFVGAGYAPRTVHGTDVSNGVGNVGLPGPLVYFFNQRVETSYPVTNGVVISGGLNLGSGHVRFSPELRYVRWTTPFLNEFGGDGSSRYLSNQNEVFVLLGVSWH
jgi:hypothetical protein